ncbi:xanthine dehydrogenase family protein molybdopterin-binding subunit [bacterium M00.F.Ca.ET.228.01.1.1]|uniref:xanthine dehydrogenase family protein molybdopterin-binding subunit n=1 Tax=Paraburkholderia phenoliruptrix TaxID=252970 RepID=UPI0010927A29|nr:xanthine dehydrogenase family protein molybdopterin-binding subunit [Paraburkholderia phenoliruptrix]TGP41397.1 xanthine dehydrogenase family protein molybdopterin-binding subunit [bacterium M00.F.Ca.ET.228.01.1.1]TGR98054.1 xanthine dehydrogenase family protein molybdopterin-binding subunit [bacterium M00.F.Ca.ET.191.01.1.1]TGU02244.1 xanthine dehydrogenase family protein molybdopterin-binding subunit [bacterium M00.F.Ca.ET.155.01.1.1]MBW0447034.1 xanthine dehydrogenase family protein molyb
MIGQPLARLEDRRFVTGNGRYTDDFQLDGQVHAAFLRSPHAHAVLRSIDVSAARDAPGVIAVLVGQDYLDDGYQGVDHVPDPVDAIDATKKAFLTSLTGEIFNQLHVPLPTDRVRYVGEPVAMVIADTPLAARNASEMIEVDYEVLDAVVNAADAMQDSAPQLWEGAPRNLCFQTQLGEREQARRVIANAALVLTREFHHSRVVNCQMEPRSAIGVFDHESGLYTLISGSQGAVRQKLCLAAALKVPPGQVRVVCPDTGGGFGPRSFIYVEQLAVVWAARRIGRPVKWTSDRSEAFLSDYQGRDQIVRATFGFAPDGRILAIDNEWIGNVGAHTVSYVPMSNGTRIMTTVYDVPVAAVHISAVLTNTVPTAPYRGAGRPEATHVIERMLDLAAAQLKLDRAEIRRRNLIAHDKLPYRSPMGLTYDSGEFARNMARALELAQWDSFEARRAASLEKGLLRGIGVANYIESPVGAPRERIELTVLPEGRIDIVAGTQSTGQGHETTFAQVIAQHLGVPIRSVTLRTGDTAFVSVGGGSHSDRSMRLGGMLLVDASAQIVALGKRVAAAQFGVSPEQVTFENGLFRDTAASRELGLFEVAAQVARDGLPDEPATRKLYAEAEVNARVPAHPTGAAVCELEVDPDTGVVTLVNYTSVDDVGQPINPLIVEGQVHGGLAQGIGQALSETCYVDRETGQVLTGSYMDYGMPRVGVIPTLNLELTEDPTKGNPLRVKGGGESGITPATATIFNALADALKAFGTDELAMPATPKVVWEYIHRDMA